MSGAPQHGYLNPSSADKGAVDEADEDRASGAVLDWGRSDTDRESLHAWI